MLSQDFNRITKSWEEPYIPVFATTHWKSEAGAHSSLCTFDFFAGSFDRLVFLISHLFLALLLPNGFKRLMIRTPLLFTITKNAVRIIIQIAVGLISLIWGLKNWLQGEPWHQEIELVTAILKFQPSVAGQYAADGSTIELNLFAEDAELGSPLDADIAKQVITTQLTLLNQLGQQPHPLVKWLLRRLTKIPYEVNQVDSYVETYRRKFLLTEQHLAGGCLYGKAIDSGLNDRRKTGKVYGSTNIHVADLSSVPLPRCSPQMTAYLVGFHVAEQLCDQ